MPASSTETSVDDIEVLTFSLQGEVFAVAAGQVREILDLVPITEVPNASPFVPGLINVRGRVVPLADLRLKLDMPQTPPTRDTRIIILDVALGDDVTTLGILADKVFSVEIIPFAAIENVPRVGVRWRQDYIAGIGKSSNRFIIILDLKQIFSQNNNKNIT